jgi:hypothetical protein
MQLLTDVSSDSPLMPRVLEHYKVAAPLMETSFAGAPIVYKNYPGGLDKDGLFHVTPFGLEVKKLLWLIHAKYAIEFYGWAPLPNDEERLRFARILLEAPPGVDFPRVKRAAFAVRDLLGKEYKLHAIPLVDGGSGIALWIPLADAPQATLVRAWLHVLANHAATHYPDLISTEQNTHNDGRVHIHVSSNAAGHYSALPYSLRAQGLTVCTPVTWSELEDLPHAGTFTAEHFPERLHLVGDLFAKDVAHIGRQTSPCASETFMYGRLPLPHGHIIIAAIEILSDGRARNAHEILAAALARKLVPPETTYHYVYSALIEYIARQLGRKRKPPILEDEQKRFHINEPPDDWPDYVHLEQPHGDAAAQALCDRLEATAHGDDPTAFEVAVCDAFAHLGFLSEHLGQPAAPDGVADAILGIDGYRILIECKTAKKFVVQPQPIEVAKFRDVYHADYCIMVGPLFLDSLQFLTECQNHNVTAIAVSEVQTLLHMAANPLEVKGLLKPGYASDLITDLIWNRAHGPAKRVTTIAFLLQREGWKLQLTAAEQGGRAHAARLTVDTAMALIDEALRAAGSAQACTREEVEEAFAYLTSPNVGNAKMEDDALVVLSSRA